MRHCKFIERMYREIYPQASDSVGLIYPPTGHTLKEIRLRPVFSNVVINNVDLSVQIGPVKLNIPLFSAAMDTVSGPDMAKALALLGGCAVIYRHKKAETQLDWLDKVVSAKIGIVENPACVYPSSLLEDARDILTEKGFSTIPVVAEDGYLAGILFTNTIAFKDRFHESVCKWMTPISDLKQVSVDTPFFEVHNRLLNEQECSVLPVLDFGRLKGLYFMKDLFHANPSMHNGKPLVGMAIGVSEIDLTRVAQALEMGVGVIVIDSSHGNCQAVIEQSRRVVKMANGEAAVIAGNVADIDGYYRLAETGVDAVKCGIGSGSICTTSNVTGAGVPMFTLIKELDFIRRKMIAAKKHAPVIIPDGGIDGPATMVIALAAGGHACMSGKWLVAADESISCQEGRSSSDMNYYRGMASDSAIKSRSAERYGKGKTAPEGIEGYVFRRGLLRKFLPKDMELVRGGCAHAGANNLEELRAFGQWPYAFTCFTVSGQEQQMNTSIIS